MALSPARCARASIIFALRLVQFSTYPRGRWPNSMPRYKILQDARRKSLRSQTQTRAIRWRTTSTVIQWPPWPRWQRPIQTSSNSWRSKAEPPRCRPRSACLFGSGPLIKNQKTAYREKTRGGSDQLKRFHGVAFSEAVKERRRDYKSLRG